MITESCVVFSLSDIMVKPSSEDPPSPPLPPPHAASASDTVTAHAIRGAHVRPVDFIVTSPPETYLIETLQLLPRKVAWRTLRGQPTDIEP
ncbi:MULTISPECIES: hypothetical protein [Modestobacter]|uniref:hypothetical protein n=1 Tax=Modestobacter TaxID=88138 RepID=UPI0018CF0544|nr:MULTISPECIES: hypothetical protein [Modestobacter]